MSDETKDPQDPKPTFDLMQKLQGRGMRKGRVTIFTDEPTAELLGGAEDERTDFGVFVQRRRWGVLGKLDEEKAKDSPDAKTVEALEKEAADLRERLNDSAIHWTLQALPEIAWKIITKDGLKKFRDDKTKKVEDSRRQEFEDYQVARLLSEMTVEIETADGRNSSISVDDAEKVPDWLPASENAKLRAKIMDLQFKAVVDASVVDDADF